MGRRSAAEICMYFKDSEVRLNVRIDQSKYGVGAITWF